MQLRVTQSGTRGRAARRSPFFQTKKLGLLGNTASLDYAPWFDPSWTLAAHPCCQPRCRREPDWYFDLHPPSTFRTKKAWRGWVKDYHGWLKRLTTPIFMQEAYADIPAAVRFPRERLMAEFRAYFTNHCAWMIALAMTEGVTHIGLFGCQYGGIERSVQRDSLTYWLGRFEQYGGTVVIPPKYNSVLCEPMALYGYESHDAETGELIPAYRVKPMLAVTNEKGEEERRELVPVDEKTGTCTIPLRELPDGERPALDRLRDLCGAGAIL